MAWRRRWLERPRIVRALGAGRSLLERLGLVQADRAGGRARPRPLLVFLLVFLLGMAVVSLVGDQGLIAYWRLQNEAERLRREVQALEERRAGLRQRIEALKNDPGYIEHLARRELGLVRPDETVVQLPEGAEGAGDEEAEP